MLPSFPSPSPLLPASADENGILLAASWAQSSMAQFWLVGASHRLGAANAAACRLAPVALTHGQAGAQVLASCFGVSFARLLEQTWQAGTLQVTRVWLADSAAGLGAPGPLGAAQAPSAPQAPGAGVAFDIGLRPWFAADGTPGGIMVTAAHVTAYDDLRQHLCAHTDAQATDEARGAFTDGLAHDLRGPLTAIRLALEGIAAAGESERTLRKSNRALAALRRADDLIENLLDISGVRANQLVPSTRTPVNLVPPLRAVLRECRETLQRTVHFAHEARLVGTCDARLLGRALYNLVQNAAKYGAPGTVIEVRLQRHVNRPTAELQVRNRGPDIAAADKARILGRFARGGTSADHQAGWGLGLMVVQAVAQAHDGEVTLRSGGGVTEFGLTFSLQRSTGQAAKPFPVAAHAPVPASQKE